MATRRLLTDEQKAAATDRSGRVFIEAAPGSGKTTVAAERFGVTRYGSTGDGRGVVAVSFARSARGELEQRILRRWGVDATRWPHKVWTLDGLHRSLVHHLLRSGAIRWPGGHLELQVLDSWRGHLGCRPVIQGQWVRAIRLSGDVVQSHSKRASHPDWYVTQAAAHRTHLDEGRCTHAEIRQILELALAAGSSLRAVIAEHLRRTLRGLIVDEVYDGNELDLAIVELAAEAGIPTTVIGDPWQALYAFRGATPQMVLPFVTRLSFTQAPITRSFRFQSTEMESLAANLRAGRPVGLQSGLPADVDVVVASEWSPMWGGSDEVLPLSFGQPKNRLDAAVALLLDHVVGPRFGRASPYGREAAAILGLDFEAFVAAAPTTLPPVLAKLRGNDPARFGLALVLLRDKLRPMSAGPIPINQAGRTKHESNLSALSRRLNKPRLVPGITVHQAKGREWDNVGVVLQGHELSRLTSGLNSAIEGDRKLYVALTRARQSTRHII